MGARDGLGIWLGRGKRRPHRLGEPGCFFPCLLVAATGTFLASAVHLVAVVTG